MERDAGSLGGALCLELQPQLHGGSLREVRTHALR
jgi:hypothetical protein